MKFKKFGPALLLCLILAFSTIASGADKEVSMLDSAVYPLANLAVKVLAIPPPAGPIISVGLGLLQVFTQMFSKLETKAEKKDEKHAEEIKAVSQVDLQQLEVTLLNSLQNAQKNIIEQIKESMNTLEDNMFSENMRNNGMDVLNRNCAEKLEIISNSKITGALKNLTVNSMLDSSSKCRETLSSFISNFIEPNVMLLTADPVKLYYEHVLEKEQLMASKENDCYSQSIHHKMFVSSLYITKMLTESYVSVLAAHVIQLQEEIKEGRLSDAEATKTISEKIINQYKHDMKKLIEKSQWALESASREIRNCGSFDLIPGISYECMTFAQIVPKMYVMQETDLYYYKCFEKDSFLNLDKYEIGECSDYDIPDNSALTVFVNLKDREHPYGFMKMKTSEQKEKTFGHINLGNYYINMATKTYEQCRSYFCHAYKKKSFGISTERVQAKPGNVITGLRFRDQNNILYIDIEQGKFIDAITVDPKTVFWTETPESDKVVYLQSDSRSFQLGDFELKKKGQYLTSLQLKYSSLQPGLIKIFFGGSSPSDWSVTSSEIKILPKVELELPEADNPTKVEDKSKNLISKPPADGYFVRFQPSGFNKDFGQCTIPCIDKREVVSDPPVPLSGFGMYHEAAVGSGGFIALKLITPKLSHLIEYEQIDELISTSNNA